MSDCVIGLFSTLLVQDTFEIYLTMKRWKDLIIIADCEHESKFPKCGYKFEVIEVSAL